MAKKRKSVDMTDQSNTTAAAAVAAAALASIGGAAQAPSTTIATESPTLHSIAAAAQQAAQQAEQQATAEVASATAVLHSSEDEDDIEAVTEEASEPTAYEIGLEKVNAYIDKYFPEMIGQEPNLRWGHFCINFPGMIGHAGKVADYALIPYAYRERFEEELAAI